MSLELVKEKINTLQIVNEENVTTIIEEDIIVPDTKPDIVSILLFETDPKIINVEFFQSSLLMKGIINYKIVYKSEDEEGQIKSIMGESDFSYSTDYSKNDKNLNCDAKCMVEHNDFELINSRKINLKSIININFKIHEEIESEFVSDISEEENLNLLKKNLNIQTFVGRNQKNLTVNDTFKTFDEDMSIQELLFFDLNIKDKNEKICNGKVEISGNVEVNAYYLCDDSDESIGSIEAVLPFSDTIELDDIDEAGSCRADYNIMDSNIDIIEDEDGELKNIECKVVLKNSVEGYLNKEVPVLVDGYSLNKKLILEKISYKTNKTLDEATNLILLNEKYSVDNSDISIEKSKVISIKPEINTYKVVDEKLLLEGVISTKLLFISRNENNRFLINTMEIPFSSDVEINSNRDNLEPIIVFELKNQEVESISNNEVQFKMEIETKVQLNEEITNEFIVEADLEEMESYTDLREPNVRIYFTKEKDSLWGIGKKYLVSLEDIITRNSEIDFDNIAVGQQVFIPKKKVKIIEEN